MNPSHPFTCALLAGVLMSITGCGSSHVMDDQIRLAIEEARQELHSENLDLDHGKDQPRAQITPRGELLIDGKAVDASAQQRDLLLGYRNRLIGIAEAGLDIGLQGGAIANQAIAGIPGLIFGGEKAEREFGRRIEAEAAKIEAEALKLCERLPEVMAHQQTLATELPAFAPYASMTQADIDDCRKDASTASARAGRS